MLELLGASVDLESVIKVASFVFGLGSAAKVIYEISTGRRSRMRDEYKFAKEFMEALAAPDPMHPFLREKGFQAIAGDNQLSADEVEYLLLLQKPDRALRDYVLGKRYIDHLPHIGNLQVKFRAKYEGSWSRSWRKTFFLIAYALLVFLAFSPLLLSKLLFKSITEVLAAFGLTLLVFGPYAWFSLVAATRIYRAEKLVQNQSKHTQSIVLGSSNNVTERTSPGKPSLATRAKR
jgi:hypothetical protein